MARSSIAGITIVLFSFCDAAAETHPDPLFADDNVLKVTITAPITTIMKDRPIDQYVAGKFAYTEPDGRAAEFDIGLRTRGRFRRRVEICDFAPLRINFKKSEIRGTLFAKQDKLKLVTHCENNSPRYQQSVVSEYLAYRILNLLTDVSFRTRLLEVTYIDTDRDNRETVSYAVFIEHQDRMAKRIDSPTVTTHMITVQMMIPEYAALAALFQYFLGNTDFSQIATAPGEDCCHNHELFGQEGQQMYSVPYDFDMTGFVNAMHARPNSRFGLRNVRDRLYRGRCLHNPFLEGAIATFNEQRDAIYALVNAQEQLTKATRRSQVRFIDSFYKTIGSDKKIENELLEECL